MLIYSRKLSSRGVLAESKAYNYFKRLVLVTQSWSARSTNQFLRSKLDAASSTGFPKFGAWWDEATSTPVAYYSGESGGEGSDGKGVMGREERRTGKPAKSCVEYLRNQSKM